jgi:hypothetical protein
VFLWKAGNNLSPTSASLANFFFSSKVNSQMMCQSLMKSTILKIVLLSHRRVTNHFETTFENKKIGK